MHPAVHERAAGQACTQLPVGAQSLVVPRRRQCPRQPAGIAWGVGGRQCNAMRCVMERLPSLLPPSRNPAPPLPPRPADPPQLRASPASPTGTLPPTTSRPPLSPTTHHHQPSAGLAGPTAGSTAGRWERLTRHRHRGKDERDGGGGCHRVGQAAAAVHQQVPARGGGHSHAQRAPKVLKPAQGERRRTQERAFMYYYTVRHTSACSKAGAVQALFSCAWRPSAGPCHRAAGSKWPRATGAQRQHTLSPRSGAEGSPRHRPAPHAAAPRKHLQPSMEC